MVASGLNTTPEEETRPDLVDDLLTFLENIILKTRSEELQLPLGISSAECFKSHSFSLSGTLLPHLTPRPCWANSPQAIRCRLRVTSSRRPSLRFRTRQPHSASYISFVTLTAVQSLLKYLLPAQTVKRHDMNNSKWLYTQGEVALGQKELQKGS